MTNQSKREDREVALSIKAEEKVKKLSFAPQKLYISTECILFDHDRWNAKNRMQRLRAEDLLAQYAQGKRNFESQNLEQAHLFEAVLPTVNLGRSCLNQAYLPYANLSQANLKASQMQRAELSNAQLYQANLSDADLQKINLSRADLCFANLSGSDLSGADLHGANLCNADLSYANLTNADLSRSNLKQANLTGTNLSGTNLFRATEADLSEAQIDQTTVYPDGHRMRDFEGMRDEG